MIDGTIDVRVLVLDTWDDITLALVPTTAVSDLKAQALREAMVTRDPAGYLVKFRGAEVADGTTLAEAEVGPNGALIVMPRRRTPVR